jgi:hypothetical protein
MSNYVVKNYGGDGVDKNLTEIFIPIGSTTPAAAATNYKQGGSDLNTIFAKFVSGSPAALTSYVVKDYGGPGVDADLKDIFQHDPLNVWSALTDYITNQNGCNNSVNAIAIDSATNNVYVGGDFTAAGGISAIYIAKWDGTIWSPLGSGILGSFVTSIAIDSATNIVYVGGSFVQAGLVLVNNIAKWNGTNWFSLGGATNGCNGTVTSIAIYNSTNIFVGGSFTTSGGGTTNRIAKWDGTTWSALDNGIANNAVYSIAIGSLNNIYVCGSFTSIVGGGTANRIAKWDGTTWTALIDSNTGVNGLSPVIGEQAESVAIDSTGNVYVGGFFTTAGGILVNRVAKWDGSLSFFSPLGSGVTSSISFWLDTVAVDSFNNVYVGGQFTIAGGNSADNVAKWNGTSWSALTDSITGFNGCNDDVVTITVDSANNVYVGGQFTTAGGGGNSANRVAKYGTIITPSIIPSGTFTSTISGSYTIVTFTGNGTISSTGVNTFYYLVVAGGGGGGNALGGGDQGGGGGGGGGVLQGSFNISISTNINITVGAGGINESNGSNSTLLYNSSNINAIGGGKGGNYGDYTGSGAPGNGGSGGGGGGGYDDSNSSAIPGGNGTVGQGNNGGSGGNRPDDNIRAGGGGGGAGAVGDSVSSINDIGGNGGNGIPSNQLPILLVYPNSVYWGGGGGGGGVDGGGSGGNGGGGNGGGGFPSPTSSGSPGTTNTGGGGGGCNAGGNVGSGGSGVVVIAYLTPA